MDYTTSRNSRSGEFATSTPSPDNQAFRRFIRRVWDVDVAPKLRGERPDQRAKSARIAGKAAAATGLAVDSLLGLKGKPFARFMTVMGSSLGAMLPDLWDWRWLRDQANDRQRRVVEEQVRQRAAQLPEREALALFELDTQATHDEFRAAWRRISKRWHPDKAPDDATRREFHVRFITYQAARETIEQAYTDGRLPQPR